MSLSVEDRPGLLLSPGASMSRTLKPLRPLALPGPDAGGGVWPLSREGGKLWGG